LNCRKSVLGCQRKCSQTLLEFLLFVLPQTFNSFFFFHLFFKNLLFISKYIITFGYIFYVPFLFVLGILQRFCWMIIFRLKYVMEGWIYFLFKL